MLLAGFEPVSSGLIFRFLLELTGKTSEIFCFQHFSPLCSVHYKMGTKVAVGRDAFLTVEFEMERASA